MISAISSVLLIILFFFLGHVTQAFKKLIGLLTKIGLKFLSFFGIKIKKKEKHLKQSNEFKETYKEIRMVKLSKKNIKQKSSIDWAFLILFVIAGILVIINLNSITGNAITNWMWNITNGVWGLIKTQADMNTFYTALLFSVLSFSASRLLSRWKETKQQRKEHKEAMLKLKALKVMDSKELIDAAKEKSEEKYKELKK